MARVTLERLRKEYENDHVAVHGLDLEVGDGEFVVLVGPSGCGKSTTLRMVAGLEAPTAGRLLIGDRDVTDVPPADRDIAMVFQNYALYPHMTVRQNMGFALRLHRHARAEIARRVDDAAATLGLGPVMDRLPRQLSGGQRQRVAIGRAIVRQPQVFLFDEPLSNLDAKLRVQMRREIAALHRRLAVTVLYVTHDQVEAMTLGDRIVVMNEGRVQQADTPAAIYARPHNTFVAAFMGSPPMNLMRGSLDDGAWGADRRFRLAADPAVEIPVGGAGGGGAVAGRPLVLGVRPEHLEVTAGAAGGADAFVAVVDLVEPLGHEALVHLRAGDVELTARVAGGGGLRMGEPAAVRVDPAHVHLFDAGDGAIVARGA